MKLTRSQHDILRLEGGVGGTVNNVCCAITASADTDLEAAIRLLYKQYQILSASYSVADDALVYGDVPAMESTQYFSSTAEYEAWALDMSKKPMDITSKLALFRPFCIAGGTHGCFMQVHHLICDGFSMKLLVDFLIRNMDGQRSDGDGPDYEEFVQAEAAYTASAKHERDCRFYRDLFSRNTHTAFLSESESMEFAAERFTAVLPEALASDLHSFAQANDFSLTQAMEAAYAMILFRVHGKGDFFLGTLSANRITPREEKMVGNLFTTSVLPVSVAENTSFSGLCANVAELSMQMMRHQRLSYSDIESLYHEAGGKSEKLFDVLFNYQSFKVDSRYTVTWYPADRQYETLLINVQQEDSRVTVHYDFRPTCISREEVARLHSRFVELVKSALEKSDDPICHLNQLTGEDIAFISDCNRTEMPFPDGETLISLFEKQVRRTPNKKALFFGDDVLTYAEFGKRVDLLASSLAKKGVLPGDIVAVRLERSFDMMTAIYAVMKCGTAYMPIGMDYPNDRVAFMLEDSGAKVLITNTEYYGINTIKTDQVDWNSPAPVFADRSKPELPAYVLYTSGSTGTPKGAVIAQHSIVARIFWMNRIFGMRNDDTVLQKTVYTFDVSLWELFWWSMGGGSLAIMEPEAHKDPQKVIDAIKRYKITKMHFVPSMLAAFLAYSALEAKPEDMASLRQVFASGEALMPAHVNEFYRQYSGAKLINLYGPTECTVDVTCFRCPREPLSVIPIGAPVDNTKLYIVDRFNNQVPVGEAGELCITGELVGLGYLNRPELTAEKFVDNPFGPGKMYKTGDLTRWNRNGLIEYLGRMDFQVKLHGQRLELGEIERCIANFAGIKQVIAAVQKDENQLLVAYYTADHDIDEEALKRHLSAKLPAYMVPQAFMHLEELPLTISGKADRKKLPKINFTPTAPDANQEMPSTPIEKAVCKAFGHALGIDEKAHISLDDDFFQLGGDSLRAITVMIDLHASYGFTIQDIYECRTVRKLAEKAETAEATDDSAYDDDWKYSKLDLPPCEEAPAERDILLTGATGLLGVHLLDELLETTEKHIYCLVRSKQKLLDHWAYMFHDKPFPAERITMVTGDIAAEKLGLDKDSYASLLAKIGQVYHAAADVRHFGEWENSYRTNTLGTRHVVEFCVNAGACLNHVSTMSVNGHLLTTVMTPGAVFDENTLFFGQRYRENVYVHSKYQAERVVIDEIRAGRLKGNIYRVGNLLWRRSDGQFQKNKKAHDFYMLSRAFALLKCYPENFKGFEFDLTPVDDCAEAIVKLSMRQQNRVWHIRNEHLMTLSSYIGRLIGGEPECVPVAEMMKRLEVYKDDPQMGFMLAYMDINKDFAQDEICVEKVNETVHALAQCGFAWQPATEAYIKLGC